MCVIVLICKEEIILKISDIDKLKDISKKVRRNIIEEVYGANSGHPGSSLSCLDIILYLKKKGYKEESLKGLGE